MTAPTGYSMSAVRVSSVWRQLGAFLAASADLGLVDGKCTRIFEGNRPRSNATGARGSYEKPIFRIGWILRGGARKLVVWCRADRRAAAGERHENVERWRCIISCHANAMGRSRSAGYLDDRR